MRVLLFGDATSPNVHAFSDALRRNGAEVIVASFETSGVGAEPGARSLPHLPLIGRARYLLGGPWARRVVRSVEPDVVVGYFVTGYGTLARSSGGSPLVLVAAGSDVLRTPLRSLAYRAGRRNLAEADLVIAGAQHVADACQRMCKATRAFVQARGVDLTTFVPADAPLGSLGIVSTRSLKPFYRHEMVIDAFGASGLATQGAALTFAGRGEERDRLRAHAAELGVEAAVTFPDFVSGSSLRDLLAGHHVYVSAAPTDGVSASLLEAMAVGLLPVVVDHPANREWIAHGHNGLLYPADSEVALVDRLQVAATDLELRDRSRQVNPEVIRDRGDLLVNGRRLVDQIRRLQRDFKS